MNKVEWNELVPFLSVLACTFPGSTLKAKYPIIESIQGKERSKSDLAEDNASVVFQSCTQYPNNETLMLTDS